MNLRIFESGDDLTLAAARAICAKVEGRERAAVGLSGGSSPKPLYELLASSPWRDRLASTAITWVLVDERYVPITDAQSNARMIEQTLFRDGLPQAHRFLRFRTELGDPPATAASFESEWHALGLNTLDLVLLGVGEDGHTASLFPGTPVLEVTDRIAAAVFVPRLQQWRVTLTLPVIRGAATRLVLAPGASKRSVLSEVRAGAAYPISLATSGDGESWFLVDREAAGI